jgi:hypothetical protein
MPSAEGLGLGKTARRADGGNTRLFQDRAGSRRVRERVRGSAIAQRSYFGRLDGWTPLGGPREFQSPGAQSAALISGPLIFSKALARVLASVAVR